ncbi:MAG: LysE family translocator [Pseudomonadota bacterium]
MSLELYLVYVAACVAIVIVPGPTVTIIIANSLAHGARAGLMNIVGTQVGLLVLLGVLVAGLAALVAQAGFVFDIVRIVGALYLICLGVSLWRSDGRLAKADADDRGTSDRRFFLQGFWIILSNPKALLFFGAFIPQFIDPSGDAALQTILLAVTFMVVATLLDGAYALGAGWMGGRLTRTRVRLIEKISGTCMIVGGLWLALSRRA